LHEYTFLVSNLLLQTAVNNTNIHIISIISINTQQQFIKSFFRAIWAHKAPIITVFIGFSLLQRHQRRG